MSTTSPLHPSLLAGRYALERELGRGATATVYLAEDRKQKRRVAVKVLHAELATALGTERFLREIEVATRLTHPHILALHDSGSTDDGTLFYVVPFLEGETLRHRLTREGRLPVDDAVHVARAIAGALDYAHRHQVVHRDVKPENILLHDGEPVLADFGIALAVRATQDHRLTQTGFAIGTPTYMSPEQCAGEASIDGRSDIYSLACVLYEMLVGEPPHHAATAQAVITRRFTEPAPSVRVTRDDVPAAIDGALATALARDPGGRFTTASAFARALSGSRPAAATGAPAERSIVVLPFENLSPDPDNAYFADGLTEELITDLSRLRGLRVISRASAVRLKGTSKDLPAIARELDVEYVLQGGVRRAGSSLRITAQLVDARRDAPVWAEKYGGTTEDVFAIQEQISRQIVEALRVTLTADEERRLGERRIDDIRVYESYHRAMVEAWRFTDAGADRALAYLRSGVELVGEHELLLGATGLVYLNCVNAGIKVDEDCLAHAEDYAARILARWPGSGLGLALRGSIQVRKGELQEAVRTLKRALAVAPNIPEALLWLGYAYLDAGRADAARPYLHRLLEVDPLTPVNHCFLGWAEFSVGRPQAAIPHYRRMFEMDPESALARFLLGLALTWAARPEALDWFERMSREDPGTFFGQMATLFVHAHRGDAERVRETVTPQVAAVARGQEFFSLRMAECFARVGAVDEMGDWFESAIALGGIDYPFYSQHHPWFAQVRGDPRFEHVMAHMRRAWETFEV